MRSLLNFIYKYHYFILFILLECLSVFFVVQYNNYQHTSFLNSSNRIAGRIYKTQSGISQYFGLKDKNKELTEIIANLNNQNKRAFKSNSITLSDIYDSVYIQQYKYIPAVVINNSINRVNNYLTLNIGSKQGVGPGMAVVAPNGIVGIVKDVSQNYASVISVLNQNLKISGMVKKNNYFGTIDWEGDSYKYVTLHDLPNHILLEKGDSIITSGYSAIFPKGEFIGLVNDISESDGGEFLSVTVKLSVDFKKLANVFVVKNLLYTEQVNLERSTWND